MIYKTPLPSDHYEEKKPQVHLINVSWLAVNLQINRIGVLASAPSEYVRRFWLFFNSAVTQQLFSKHYTVQCTLTFEAVQSIVQQNAEHLVTVYKNLFWIKA